MNYGSHVPYNGQENQEFFVQQILMQLLLEELLGRAADKLLVMYPHTKAVVMLTDRDAAAGKLFTSPFMPSIDVQWPTVLARAAWLLGRNGLTDRDLTRRYQLGAVLLQSLAVFDGHLNVEKYNKICLGPDGTNPVRSETAEAAQADDEASTKACEETYPPEDICRITNTVREGVDQKNQHLLDCVMKAIDTINPQEAHGTIH